MAFPNITYKFNGLIEAKALTAVVDLKFASLEKFTKDNAIATSEVEFEKVASNQQGRIYRVEANVIIDGALYRAEATEESFEKAVDEVRNELDKEMSRAKDRQVSLEKHSGREFKEQMQNGGSEI